MRHVGRLVGFASVRRRRQIGAVGLDQAAVQRHQARHRAQFFSILEGQDAGEGNVEAQVQCCGGDLAGFGETVEDTTHPALPFIAQHGQRVVTAAAGVHHQRQAGRMGGADVYRKALALPGHVGNAAAIESVVVQPGFAQGHHPRQRGAVQQGLQIRLQHAFVVGVHAHRAPEVAVRRRECMHGRKFFQRGADAQRAIDVGVGHGLAHAGDVFVQAGEAQVAMGIDVHRGGAGWRPGRRAQPVKASASAWPRRCWCPGSLRS